MLAPSLRALRVASAPPTGGNTSGPAKPVPRCFWRGASEATDAAKHKIDEKRADSDAKKSGPVGKAVNNVKSGYHKNRSQSSADKAKKALKNAG